MTVDEAISFTKEKAMSADSCAYEYAQLVDFLKELKIRREQELYDTEKKIINYKHSLTMKELYPFV